SSRLLAPPRGGRAGEHPCGRHAPGPAEGAGHAAELQAAGAAQVRLRTVDAEDAAAELTRLGLAVTGRQQAADGSTDLTATLPEGAPAAEHVVAELVAAGVGVRGFEVRRPSMEELFVALT